MEREREREKMRWGKMMILVSGDEDERKEVSESVREEERVSKKYMKR